MLIKGRNEGEKLSADKKILYNLEDKKEIEEHSEMTPNGELKSKSRGGRLLTPQILEF